MSELEELKRRLDKLEELSGKLSFLLRDIEKTVTRETK